MSQGCRLSFQSRLEFFDYLLHRFLIYGQFALSGEKLSAEGVQRREEAFVCSDDRADELARAMFEGVGRVPRSRFLCFFIFQYFWCSGR